MRKILLLTEILILFSCRNDHQNLSLTNILKGDCCWDRTEEDGVIGGLNSCYRFLPEGQCYFYYYKFYNRQITDSVYRYDDGDVVVPDTWSVQGDTLLIARGSPYRVLDFSKEAVTVENNHDTIILRENCHTLFKKKHS
jgi:hypothetical protein